MKPSFLSRILFLPLLGVSSALASSGSPTIDTGHSIQSLLIPSTAGVSIVDGSATPLMNPEGFSVAAQGGTSSGGGDIQCDNLIQNLSYQDPKGNLESWIRNGGPKAGKLDLSSSLDPQTGSPYTYAEYESAMLKLLEEFKKSPDINCVRPGDKGYPVDVGDRAKICKTSVDHSGVHMTCDRTLFMGLTTDEQIEQNHHEFAINVPGLEPDSGSISTYKISDQLFCLDWRCRRTQAGCAHPGCERCSGWR